jgi:hypothetical protein
MSETNPDSIQKLVNGFNIELLEQKCNFVLVHYLLGTTDNPYALRRTKIYVKKHNSMLENILDENTSANDENISSEDEEKNRIVKHKKALNEYIQYLDREHTFLRLIVDKMIKDKIKDNGSKFNHCKQLDVDYCSAKLLIKNAKKTTQSKYKSFSEKYLPVNMKWILSKTAVDILAPRTLVQTFFTEVYAGSAVSSKWDRQFELLRSILIGQLSSLKFDFSSQKNIEENIENTQSVWNILASIQSALIYSNAVSTIEEGNSEKKYNQLSYSAFAIINSEKSKDDAIESIVIIASPSLDINIKNSGILSESRRIFKEKEENREPEADQSISIKDILEIDNNNTSNAINAINKFWEENIGDYLQKIFHYKDSSLFDITAWLMLLTTYLTYQKHEGTTLDFFFVYGDLSQFEDLKMYRAIQKEQLEEFEIPKNPKDKGEILEKAKALAIKIANEHYPWFENGRYALFWNTGSKDSYPIGLVLIENFTWLQVLNNRFIDELPFKIPNCFITYVYGEAQRIGSISIVKNKVEDILLYKDRKWMVSNSVNKRTEQLKSELEKILNINENSQKKESLSKTIKLALQIAENPKKGGIIVFINQEKKKDIKGKFQSMGDSWKQIDSNESSEDVLALISQDGATLRILDNDGKDSDSWSYRNFLIPSDRTIELLEQIKSECNKKTNKHVWPLIAKGSRRWSAAMTACHPDVDAVLVISQDGDIQLWYIKNKSYTLNKKGTKVKVVEFPIGGEAESLIEYEYSTK